MHSPTFSKASSSLTIFFLLVVLIFHQVLNSVKADESLIREECHYADVPAVCVKYVESDPRSETADRVGIARIIIDKLRNLAGTIAPKITSFASTKAKPRIKDCAKAYANANSTYLPIAKEYLNKGNYDLAEKSISLAIYHCFLSCPPVKFPDDVAYDIHIYEDLTNAAQRIIERF